MAGKRGFWWEESSGGWSGSDPGVPGCGGFPTDLSVCGKPAMLATSSTKIERTSLISRPFKLAFSGLKWD